MKTAIFIRGHARTWPLTKSHTLGFFEDIYGQVDWYVGFVDTGTVSQAQLADDFNAKNLVAALLLDQTGYPLTETHESLAKWAGFHQAYWRLAWIDYHLGRAKRHHERHNHVTYDNVLFIRPDVFYYLSSDEIVERVRMRLDLLSVSEIGSNGDVADDWFMGDLIYRAGPAAADLLSLRYIDPQYSIGAIRPLIHGNSHVLIAQYVPRRLIGHNDRATGIESCLIRPDHLDHLPLDRTQMDPNFRDSRTWSARPVDEKLAYCRRLGISPADYQLPS